MKQNDEKTALGYECSLITMLFWLNRIFYFGYILMTKKQHWVMKTKICDFNAFQKINWILTKKNEIRQIALYCQLNIVENNFSDLPN